MRGRGEPDAFVIANGPEDGTDFPITRAPFSIGANHDAGVRVVLDNGVKTTHAHVWAAPNGYRIRRADNAPVYVNGKRAGLVRSRIAGDGSVVQIGSTMICVACSPDGLASRSGGMVLESDLAWGARALFRNLLGLLKSTLHLLILPFRRARGLIVPGILAVIVLALLFAPAAREFIFGWVRYGFGWIRVLLSRMGV